MDSTGRIWVALDTTKDKALEIAERVAGHPAVRGFKANRLVDQEVFRPDGDSRLFDVLASFGKPAWADLKLIDIPETVSGRIEPYVQAGGVGFITVMAKGEVDMMMAAVKAGGDRLSIIAVTELTSLSEEQVHLGSGNPAKASVINLARLAVLSGVKHLVCSGQELEVLAKRPELVSLVKFVPALSPAWSFGAGADQNRVTALATALKNGASAAVIGRVIINAKDPLEAIKMTAGEIEAI